MHTDLRIHAAAQKLVEVVSGSIEQMRRDVKPVFGREMFLESLAITTLIQRANMADDREQHIVSLLEKKARIEVMLQAALNRKYISPGVYGEATELATSIGRQASGWRKDTRKRQLPGSQGSRARA